MPKDMSERMSEDICQEDISEDMSERISKDLSERSAEDCFQSVCKIENNRTHFRRWIACLPSPDPIRMWRVHFVIDKMETRWAQNMTFGFSVFKRKMLNRGKFFTSVIWKWNFVRSCWCCCLRLDAKTKHRSSPNWHSILFSIHSQIALLLELDNNPSPNNLHPICHGGNHSK